MLSVPHAIADRVVRRALDLPLGSALRRRLLKRALVRGWEATIRGDFGLFPLLYEPTVELHVVGVVVGLAERYQGVAAMVEAVGILLRELEPVGFTPEQMVDSGDEITMRFRVNARGIASGAETTRRLSCVYQLSERGKIAGQELCLE